MPILGVRASPKFSRGRADFQDRMDRNASMAGGG